MTKANERQIGGDHYKVGGEEHWDRVARLGLDYFQACITKYVERWRLKGGLQDLEKARHFLDKYIELNQPPTSGREQRCRFMHHNGEQCLLLDEHNSPHQFKPTVSDQEAELALKYMTAGMLVECDRCHKLFPHGQRWVCTASMNILQPDLCVSKTEDVAETATNTSQIKPTAYNDFTYEGGTSSYDLYRCRHCRMEVRVSVGSNPNAHHSHGEEPTAAYVNQG